MRAGLTQGDVAALMGTTQSVVARIESGRGTPSMRTVQRFACAVGARAVVRMEPLKTWYGETYERRHHPIDLPDPVEAIKFRMEQAGLSVNDLVPMIGQPNRVYEVLNYKRPLTLGMIRNLNTGLGT